MLFRSGMVLQILLRQINLGFFLMVAARRIILAISVPATTSSAMVIRSLGSQRRRRDGALADVA